MNQKNWEVYIIQSESGKLYTGITNDLNKRFKDHLETKKGAKFFRLSKPEKIVFRETYPNRSEAQKAEIKIKKMSRAQKLELMSNHAHPPYIT